MLLRSLCAVVAVAWLVKTVADPPEPRRVFARVRHEPVVLGSLLLLAAAAISTLTSIDRLDSFAGSYLRAQGFYTTLCYVIAGLAVAANLRSTAQVDRLLRTIVLASVPAALYGILQAGGVDPLEWTTDWKGRAASTQGNPVFLGAVLCMVAPVTLVRLGSAIGRARAAPRVGVRSVAVAALFVCAQLGVLTAFVLLGASRNSAWWAALPVLGVFLLLVLAMPEGAEGRAPALGAAFGYGLALAGEIAALALSQSRGPLLGLLAGCVGVAFAALVRHGRRSLRLAAVASLAVVLAGLLAASLVGGPFERVRLAQLFESGGGSGRVRVLIWQGALRIVADHPVATPSGDALNRLRLAVGYGPETFRDVYSHVYQPELGRLDPDTPYAVPDRAHDAPLDALVAGGVVGLVAYLLVFNLFLAFALERTGLVPSDARRRVRLLVVVTGVLGVAASLCALLWRRSDSRARATPVETAAVALLGLGVAHFVETLFGFGTISTLSTVWLAIGAVVALGFVRDAPRRQEAVVRQFELALPVAYVVGSAALVAAAAAWEPAETVSPPILLALGFLWLVGAILVWAAPVAVRLEGGRSVRVAAVAGLAGLLAAVVLNAAPVGADVHFRRAISLEESGASAAARRQYELAVEVAPRNDFYRRRYGAFLAGEAQFARDPARDLGAARASFERALVLAPTDPDSYAGLARLYRSWAETARGETRERILARAAAWYRRGLALIPGGCLLRLELGRTELARGRYGAAVAALTRAIAVEPTPGPAATELRGDAFFASADYERAVRDYRAALRLVRPEDEERIGWRIHRNLGIAYARVGESAHARRELAAARASAPRAEREAIDAVVESLGLRRADS